MGGKTVVEAPAPVDPAKVGADTLETQLRLAPDVFAANAQYLPQYVDLAMQVSGQALPGLLAQQQQANSAQRSADIADVRNLAPAALEAWRAANPDLVAAQGALADRIASTAAKGAPTVGRYSAAAPALGNASMVRASTAGTPGLYNRLEASAAGALDTVSPLQLELQKQAMEQLGADLSPEQLAKVQQDTRSAYAARGLYDSNQAIGAEILNTDAARAARRSAAQQFAMGVDAAGQQQIAANRSYAGSVAGMGINQNQFNASQRQQANLSNQSATNQYGLARYGTEAGLNQFNAQMGLSADQINAQLGMQADQQAIANYFNLANQYAATAQDPYQLVLGRSGAPAAAAGLASSAGPTMFDPFNPAITSIYAGNTANQLAANTATANNAAAVTGGGLSALGSLGGAGILALALCWVAREVYGETNPRWLEFRRWLLRHAPRALFLRYLEHGERFARLIRNRPILKLAIREWMDARLAAPVTL